MLAEAGFKKGADGILEKGGQKFSFECLTDQGQPDMVQVGLILQQNLKDLGIEMKGRDVGLVDFPGEIGGRPVYLCWRLGEPAVAHWHERDAGFAGRQPLAPNAIT